MILKDIYYYFFNKKLQDHIWLNHQICHLHNTPSDIIKLAGCSHKSLKWKETHFRKKGLIMKDELGGIHTGTFHAVGKKLVILILQPFIPKITKIVNQYYPKVKSRNARIFSTIINEMESVDRDEGSSMAKRLKLTRKQFYLLAAKFTIVLYEFDSYYAERMDFILKRVTEQHDKFYLDELANPKYWAPYRPMFLGAKYFAMRVTDTNVQPQVFYVTKDKDGNQELHKIDYKKKEE